ncbi:MAG: hypothetical protein AB4426_31325 [Xenococcaceae cyanobacterium]
MRQSNLKKDLLFLAKGLLFSALVSGVLVSCILGKVTYGATDSLPARQEQLVEDYTKLTKRLNQVKAEVNIFKNSLDKFNTELKSEDKRKKKQVDFENPNQKLDALLKAWNQFNGELQKSNVQLPELVKKLTQQVDFNLKYIQKILSPLKKGLIEGKVEQVQKHLDFFDREGIQPQYYGKFGPRTQQEIEKVSKEKLLQAQNAILEINIYLLDTTISSSKVAKIQQPSEETKNLQAEIQRITDENQHLKEQLGVDKTRLAEEIQRLETENQKLSDELSRANKSKKNKEILLIFFIFGEAAIILWLRHRNKELRHSLPRQTTIKDNDSQHELENETGYPDERIEGFSQEDSSSNWNDARTHQRHYSPSWDTRRNPENDSSYKPNNQQNAPVTKPNLGVSSGRSSKTARHHESSLPDDDLVVIHNKKPNLLAGKTIKVSATKESIEKRRLGYNYPVILEEVSNGNYWIVTDKASDYMIPKKNLIINKPSYETVQELFELSGYQSRQSNKFDLIKPARVTPMSGDKWELMEKGKLRFY